jgi:hypothetical protein
LAHSPPNITPPRTKTLILAVTQSSSAELVRTEMSHVGVQGEVVVQVVFAGDYVERPKSSKRLFSISRSLMKLLD